MRNDNFQSKEMITSWYRRSLSNKGSPCSFDTFDRFIALWISFNGFYVWELYSEAKGSCGNGEPTDYHFIKAIREKDEYKEIYITLLKNRSYSYLIAGFFDLLNGDSFVTHFKGRVADLRHPNSETKATKFDDINNFSQFIGVVYQIRCNLFHGNKSIDNESDLKLVEGIIEPFQNFVKEVYLATGYLNE